MKTTKKTTNLIESFQSFLEQNCISGLIIPEKKYLSIKLEKNTTKQTLKNIALFCNIRKVYFDLFNDNDLNLNVYYN